MIIKISHSTKYSFNKPVFLEPHTIRLSPKTNSTQKLHNFTIKIDPQPIGKSDCIDLFDNNSIILWFENLHKNLTITTVSTVETLRHHPFDYIITDNSANTLPVSQKSSDSSIIKKYTTNEYKINKNLKEIVDSILKQEKNQTLPFLSNLTSFIYKNFTQINRKHGEPLSPDKTIKECKGACRDFAVLFIEACRSVNLPTRFVSGYCYSNSKNTVDELHSWAEVYLPGGGWRGYDPSLGLAVDDSYVVIAAGINSKDVTPVSGSLRGDDVSSTLKYEIKIKASSN